MKNAKLQRKNLIFSPQIHLGVTVAEAATAKQEKNGKQSQFLHKLFEIKRLW